MEQQKIGALPRRQEGGNPGNGSEAKKRKKNRRGTGLLRQDSGRRGVGPVSLQTEKSCNRRLSSQGQTPRTKRKKKPSRIIRTRNVRNIPTPTQENRNTKGKKLSEQQTGLRGVGGSPIRAQQIKKKGGSSKGLMLAPRGGGIGRGVVSSL